jgi:hypothetical protein
MKTNSDLSFTLYEILKEVLFGTKQTRGSLRKELENIKAHLKLSFERECLQPFGVKLCIEYSYYYSEVCVNKQTNPSC